MIGRRDPGLGARFLNPKLHLHKLNTFSRMSSWTSILSTSLMVIAAKAGVTDPVCSLSDHPLLQLAALTASDAPRIRKRHREALNGNPGPPPFKSNVHAARSVFQNKGSVSLFHISGAAATDSSLFAPADPNRLFRRMFSLSATRSPSLGAIVEVVEVPGYIDDFSHSISHKDTGHSIVTEALENVLHKHKDLQLKDAQFISRNCPAYISKVVAANSQRLTLEKHSKDEDGILIEQWMMDNVNELEPFLESIGLDPEKVEEVLPFVQIPLNGEQGLLRNVEILEGLGISRGSLWDVLEQNKQLLAMTPADLRATVDFLEGLGVKRSKEMVGLIEDSVFLTDSLATLKNLKDVGVQKDVIAKILKSDSLGGGHIDMPVGSFQERVEFLVESGLSKHKVVQSLKLFPQLLHLRLENLRRKIQFFDSIGLERDRVAKIIARWPLVFGESMEKKLRPKIEMLQSLGVGRDGIAKILTRYPELRAVSLEYNLKQKVAFFEKNGLRGKRLVKLLTSHPRALTLSVNELNNKLDFLVQKGFSPGSVEMVRALGVCITISVESMAARFVNLESLGFSPEEGREVVKQQPAILSLSEKCIQDKVHYLLNDMQRSIDEIVKCPCYLLYSLKLRIKPRHRVLSLLKSEGALREESYSLNTIMIMSEKRFMERFVISLGAQFPQVAAAYYYRG
ncbi:unnamed protein product [Calypogeia fissa]